MQDRFRRREVNNGRPTGSEMTFADLGGVLRQRWRLPALATVVALAAGLVFGFITTPIYRAQAVLSPVANESEGMLSSLANEVGGLAALAGISLTGGKNRSQEAIATLQSRALTEQYVKERGLLPVLF